MKIVCISKLKCFNLMVNEWTAINPNEIIHITSLEYKEEFSTVGDYPDYKFIFEGGHYIINTETDYFCIDEIDWDNCVIILNGKINNPINSNYNMDLTK